MAEGENVVQMPCRECGGDVAPRKHKPTCSRSPESMRRLLEIRREKAKTNPGARGGRPKRLTNAEVRERALEKAADVLIPHRAKAITVLADQLDSRDPVVAQRAAKLILEYTDGKPLQRIEEKSDNVTEVVYRTAALPVVFAPEEPAEATGA